MLHPTVKEPSSVVHNQICKRFSLDEIRSATLDFNEALVIGRGGFGEVYKGRVNINGSTTTVAIKRLRSMSVQGAPEFWVEIEMLSKLRHCNIVSLIGYCNEGIEMILVYDFMLHGTLADRLRRADASLTWLKRLDICIGAARGLEYLHTGTSPLHGIIHRDVKTSNVLLDENFVAKVSDLGLAKLCPTNLTGTSVSTGVKGTFGYLDPCYFYTGKLTTKSDVYSFGVLLLEVMCGRPAVDMSLNDEECGLAPWAQGRIKEGKLNQIIDFRLRWQTSSNCLKQFALIACRCLDSQRKQRPTMAEIIAKLEHIVSLQNRLDSSLTHGTTFIDKLRSVHAKVQLQAGKWMSPHTAEVGSGSNDASRLIHFSASSLSPAAVMVGNNSYWTSYRDTMENGDQVVIRSMKKILFWEEDSVLRKIYGDGKLCHVNILAPKFYYYNKDETIYLSTFMENGSLSGSLHSSKGQEPGSLYFSYIMKLIIGITKGLVYLHTQEKMVHGYLTSGNVLLDIDYDPVIADVGLSMLTIDARPEFPFDHAPELLKFQDANVKTDVYSLGLIMLELLTRKSSNSRKHEINLPRWVMSIPREKLKSEVFDPEFRTELPYIKPYLFRILDLAMACVNLSPNRRPEAYEVLQQVQEIAAAVPEKRKP